MFFIAFLQKNIVNSSFALLQDIKPQRKKQEENNVYRRKKTKKQKSLIYLTMYLLFSYPCSTRFTH